MKITKGASMMMKGQKVSTLYRLIGNTIMGRVVVATLMESSTYVRVLSNVRHVPDLRKNLISLGVLDDLGYSYSSKGGIMKVTKGALMVMKGQKISTLYRLIGNIVVGRVVVTTSVESSIDDTKLWHMRLGHIGERGMLELHKRNLLKGVKTCKLDFCKYCVYEK